MTRIGSDADSGISTCTTTNATAPIAKHTNSTMILQLLQAYVEPPHSSANSKLATAGTKKAVPMGSSFRICLAKLS